MANLESRDTDFVRVAALEAGDQTPPFVAKRAQFVQRRREFLGDETAVFRARWQFGRKRQAQPVDQLAMTNERRERRSDP